MTEGSSSALDDVELQTDILVATGVDLRRKDKRKRVCHKPRTGLTDIRCIHKNTARKRLASKVFSKSVFIRGRPSVLSLCCLVGWLSGRSIKAVLE